MSIWRYIEVLVAWAGFLVVALALGEGVLRLIERIVRRWRDERAEPAPTHGSAERFGLAIIVGLCTYGTVGIVLGVAHVFHWATLLAVAIAAVVLLRGPLLLHLRWLRTAPQGALHDARTSSFVAILLALAAGLYTVWWFVALGPPTEADALAYHLPEAQYMVDEHALPWTFLGHWFYGNLPKLAEVMWAQGLAFVDLGFTQTLHYTFHGALILLVYGRVRALWGIPAAAVAALGVVAFPDLLLKATTPYVDAAVVACEAGALLYVASWLQHRQVEHLGYAAVLIGFGLGIKYSAGFTAAFLTVVVAIFLIRRYAGATALKLGAALSLLAAAAGGFWYVKNLVRFGNPVYPMYIGHEGVSDDAYESTLNAIEGFSGERSFFDMVKIPLDYYANVVGTSQFFAFVAVPFSLLLQRSQVAVRLLVVYFALYVPYWYWLASHQTRFLMPAIVAGIVLLGAVSGALIERLSLRVVYAIAAAGVILAVASVARTGVDKFEANIGFPPGFPEYQVGAISADDYLEDKLGCGYSAARHLQREGLKGEVADNWTTWHGVSFGEVYAAHNPFRLFRTDPDKPGFWDEVRDEDIRFVYWDESIKALWAEDTDPGLIEFGRNSARTEKALMEHAREIWRGGSCVLYELTPPQA